MICSRLASAPGNQTTCMLTGLALFLLPRSDLRVDACHDLFGGSPLCVWIVGFPERVGNFTSEPFARCGRLSCTQHRKTNVRFGPTLQIGAPSRACQSS